MFSVVLCLFGKEKKKKTQQSHGARVAQRKWRHKRLNGIKAFFFGAANRGNKSWGMSHMKPAFMGVPQLSLGENSRIHIHLAPAFVSWKSSTPVVSEYRMLHSFHTGPGGISAPVCFVA